MGSEKTKPGTMQVKDGKMRIYLNDDWQDFGVDYVAKDMRKIAKPVRGGRITGYAPLLRTWAGELEAKGLAAIKPIQERLKVYWGCSEHWMREDCKVWHGWLNQIYQFRNINTKKDKPTAAKAIKAFGDNFDSIFSKEGVVNG